MINIQKTAYRLLILIVIVLATSPAFALGEQNKNLLLIGVMAMSPLLVIFFNNYQKSDIWIIILVISVLVIPYLNRPTSMRWSTVLYTCMFSLTFMAYTRLLTISKLTAFKFMKILRALIIAYFVVLIIQQICVLLGLPIFNVNGYDKITPWKLNALASEPSHTSRIVAFLMYCFIIVKELVLKRSYNLKQDALNDIWLWISFFWTMITIGASTSFIFLPLVLLKFIRLKNLLPLLLLMVIVYVMSISFGLTAFDRAYGVFLAVISQDIETITNVDHSASIRIVPILVLIPILNITTTDGLFGHGIDYVASILYLMVPGIEKGMSGGGLLQLWVDYGFIIFIVFTFGSLYFTFSKRNKISIFFWILMVFMYGVNNQILWLFIIFMYTVNSFTKLPSLKKHHV